MRGVFWWWSEGELNPKNFLARKFAARLRSPQVPPAIIITQKDSLTGVFGILQPLLLADFLAR